MMLNTIKNTIRNFLSPRAIIFMYHQVCQRRSDPWQLAVSPENFEQQLELLKRSYKVIPLEELVHVLKRKKLQNKMAAITFDDGSSDNYFNARPRLKAENLPATFYCTTHGPAETKHSYWWDELEALLLHTERLPRELGINIGGALIEFRFDRDATLTEPLRNQIKGWNADMHPCNERLQLFYLLWRVIQPLTFSQQLSILHQLKDWAELSELKQLSEPVMNVQQMNDLIRDPLFCIGAHTVHHPMLSVQDVEVQAFEVRESKQTLEQWLNRNIDGFAYPFGNYDSTTKALLRDAGFRYAVSTDNRPVTESEDFFELPRVHVKNWNKNEFESEINKMLAS